MKRMFLLLWLLATTARGTGLKRYEEFIPPAAAANAVLPKEGVRVTYLGTNGYLLETRDTVLLVDPYFSRVGLLRAALGLKTITTSNLMIEWLRKTRRIDAVIVTHGHVDHLFDAPEIMRRTGAQLIASPTSVWLVRGVGTPWDLCRPVLGGAPPVRIRGARVWPLRATHDHILGMLPFNGTLDRMPSTPPSTVGDWKCGEPLAFVIELGGKRIFINSGSDRHDAPPTNLGHIDVAILGLATRDARAAYPEALANLRPRFIVPSHQDDFFRPIDRPFQFLPGSDFPAVLRMTGEWKSRLRLLRPFQPWILR